MGHHKNSISSSEEEAEDKKTILNSKNKIYLRAEHLLCVTITKTSVDLAQRVSSMFTDAFKEEQPINGHENDDDESILSVHNMTGYQIVIDELTGVEVSL